MSLKDKYAFVGLGVTKQGKIPEKTCDELAAEAILDAGTHEQKEAYLEKIAMGEIRATLAIFEEDSGNGAAGITLTATAEGEDFLLNGTKLFVLDGHVSATAKDAATFPELRDIPVNVTILEIQPDCVNSADAASPAIQRLIFLDRRPYQRHSRFFTMKATAACRCRIVNQMTVCKPDDRIIHGQYAAAVVQTAVEFDRSIHQSHGIRIVRVIRIIRSQ